MAEEMRAIVPGYQPTTAGRGRPAIGLRPGRRRPVDGNNNNHASITRGASLARRRSRAVRFFSTRSPLLPRFTGNWNRRFRVFSAIFSTPLSGAHATPGDTGDLGGAVSWCQVAEPVAAAAAAAVSSSARLPGKVSPSAATRRRSLVRRSYRRRHCSRFPGHARDRQISRRCTQTPTTHPSHPSYYGAACIFLQSDTRTIMYYTLLRIMYLYTECLKKNAAFKTVIDRNRGLLLLLLVLYTLSHKPMKFTITRSHIIALYII